MRLNNIQLILLVLRILQYLRGNPAFRLPDSEMPVDFRHDPIEQLDTYRNRLFQEELSLR